MEENTQDQFKQIARLIKESSYSIYSIEEGKFEAQFQDLVKMLTEVAENTNDIFLRNFCIDVLDIISYLSTNNFHNRPLCDLLDMQLRNMFIMTSMFYDKDGLKHEVEPIAQKLHQVLLKFGSLQAVTSIEDERMHDYVYEAYLLDRLTALAWTYTKFRTFDISKLELFAFQQACITQIRRDIFEFTFGRAPSQELTELVELIDSRANNIERIQRLKFNVEMNESQGKGAPNFITALEQTLPLVTSLVHNAPISISRGTMNRWEPRWIGTLGSDLRRIGEVPPRFTWMQDDDSTVKLESDNSLTPISTKAMVAFDWGNTLEFRGKAHDSLASFVESLRAGNFSIAIITGGAKSKEMTQSGFKPDEIFELVDDKGDTTDILYERGNEIVIYVGDSLEDIRGPLDHDVHAAIIFVDETSTYGFDSAFRHIASRELEKAKEEYPDADIRIAFNFSELAEHISSIAELNKQMTSNQARVLELGAPNNP